MVRPALKPISGLNLNFVDTVYAKREINRLRAFSTFLWIDTHHIMGASLPGGSF